MMKKCLLSFLLICVVSSALSCLFVNHMVKMAKADAYSGIYEFLHDSVQYRFIENHVIDSLDESVFHHLDILANLSDSSDIRLWEKYYGGIQWIWPYFGDVWQEHSFFLAGEGLVTENVSRPFKFGVFIKPSPDAMDVLDKVGAEALTEARGFTSLPSDHPVYDGPPVDRDDLAAMVDNRYFHLVDREPSEPDIVTSEDMRKFGTGMVLLTSAATVYFDTEMVGYYCVASDTSVILADKVILSVVLSLVLSCFAFILFKRKRNP